VKQIEWTDTSIEDMAAVDKGIARRVKQSVERFAETGAGSVKRLQGIADAQNADSIAIQFETDPVIADPKSILRRFETGAKLTADRNRPAVNTL
jgi:hypothetical protein